MDRQNSHLVDKIINKIYEDDNKRITFYQFMKMALYEDDLGYYTKERLKIGKSADFYTSSSVGPAFGKTFANNFLELFTYIENNQCYNIVEIGGGNGRFARDVLDEIKVKNIDIYNNLTYYMSETSSYHEKLQSETLKEHIKHICWIREVEELPQSFQGIFFSNELIDAFPVHKVIKENNQLKEIYVTYDDKNKKFKELDGELSDGKLSHYFTNQEINLIENQVAEVNTDAIEWLESISKILNKGYIVTVDYGYDAEELYRNNRMAGTLMCYHKHTAIDNPYENIGDQDITSHVNFSLLINHGQELDVEKVWFTTQSKFLMNNGILSYLQENPQDEQGNKMNRAIRQLILPEQMGETFKVLVQQKNIQNNKYKFLEDIWKQY